MNQILSNYNGTIRDYSFPSRPVLIFWSFTGQEDYQTGTQEEKILQNETRISTLKFLLTIKSFKSLNSELINNETVICPIHVRVELY